MPNWCAGTLRVRGTKENLTKFVLEGLQPIDCIGKDLEALKMDDYCCVECRRCWIKGTYRGFVVDSHVYFDDLEDEEECVNRMFDSQLNEMMKDLVKVLHDLEWWQSCDCDEKRYREEVTKFKKKWFKQTKIDVQKQIESEFERTKDELMKEFKYLNDDE